MVSNMTAAGVTAKQVERKLHIEERSQWLRRGSFDRLILMDWTTEKLDNSSDPSLKMVILKVSWSVIECRSWSN